MHATKTTHGMLAMGMLLLSGCLAEPRPTSPARAGTEYEMTFQGTWTRATHPLDYPEAGLLTGPHFSGIIGTTHARGYDLFPIGQAPSPGIERLSEEGKHTPLDDEIQRAVTLDVAGMRFRTGPLKDLGETLSARIHVDEAHPLVSAVAMIAPSPDWFAGVKDVLLLEDGRWVEEKVVTVYAYDSGGDDGTTYLAADADTEPKRPTMLNRAPQFIKNGELVPVGRITFRKL